METKPMHLATAPNSIPRHGPRGGRRGEFLFVWLAGAVLLLVVGLVARNALHSNMTEAPARSPASPAAPADAVPRAEADRAARFPVPVAGDAASLPPLAESDDFVRQAVTRFIGSDAARTML